MSEARHTGDPSDPIDGADGAMHAADAGAATGRPAISWADIAAHRERLVRIARRRCPSREDAEDVVQEAMVRCATFEGIDPQRLGAFLTTVTVRLCADIYREAARSQRAASRLDLDDVPAPEDEVLRAADAAVIGRVLATLPDKQRAVLVDRASGMSVTQIGRRHALSYKAAESALSRARNAMRLKLASALSAVGAATAAVRRRPLTAAAVPVATLAICGTVLHGPWTGGLFGSHHSPRATRLLPGTDISVAARSDARRGTSRPPLVPDPVAAVRRAVDHTAQPPSLPPRRKLVDMHDDNLGTSTEVSDDGGPPVTVEYAEKCVTEGPYVTAKVTLEDAKAAAGCGRPPQDTP
jgi:RNA polymerase sigma factor (sigma-70 family)